MRAFRSLGRLLRRTLAVLAAALMLAAPVLVLAAPALAADGVKAAKLSDAEREEVSQIQQYLNSIRSLEARFLQVSSNGTYSEGMLYISRPGKLRINYDPPVPVVITTTGTWLVYYDRELEQFSHVPLDQTPAGLLVRDNVDLLSDELVITGFEHEAHTYRLTLVRASDPLEGSLTLVLADRPMQLKKWEITDPQGVTTTVSLLATKFGVELDDKLFEFKDPRLSTQQEN